HLDEDIDQGVAEAAELEFLHFNHPRRGLSWLAFRRWRRRFLPAALACASGLDRPLACASGFPSFRAGQLAATLDEGDGDALHDQLAVLVEDLPSPGDLATATPAAQLLVQDGADDVDGVAGKDRLAEVPFLDAQDRQGPHGRRVQAQPRADREDQQAVRDGPAERRAAREVVIDVDGVEVAGQPGEVDHIGFGDGAAERTPLLADLDVVEEQVAGGERHGPSFSWGGGRDLALLKVYKPVPATDR